MKGGFWIVLGVLLFSMAMCIPLFLPQSPLSITGRSVHVPKGGEYVEFDNQEIIETQKNPVDNVMGGNFTRDSTSGPGTGKFIGRGFEFRAGNCTNPEGAGKVPGKMRRWREEELGCERALLDSDWCARSLEDDSIYYTLRFISWSIGPEAGKCIGACNETANNTAYIRVKVDESEVPEDGR